MKISPKAQHRFATHSKSTAPMVLADDHPAVVEARPLFMRSANEHKRHKARILVSGHNSRKIGKIVTKGALAGFPIYTLTLTERATCPRDCHAWNFCYGNRSPWALRWPAGPETEAKIERELIELQAKHPKGFLVRCHVLGDYYSVEYVNLWRQWLERFPALHVFGYTARHDEIGITVRDLALENWTRFAVRSSDARIADLPAAIVIKRDAGAGEAIICPAQTDATQGCSSCALCWSTKKTIAFMEH